MSLENAILELAKAMNNNAEAMRESRQPVEIIAETPKPKKSKAKKEVEVTIEPAPEAVVIPAEVTEKVSVGYKPAEEIVPVEEQPKSIAKVEIKKEIEEIEEIEEVAETTDTITYDDFQELAKIKMKLPNVDRNDIKKIVNDIKKDAQISDLTAEELALGYENMKLLK